MWSRCVFLFALFLFVTPVASMAQSSSSASLLAVCEGDGCSLWEFHGGRATGTFPSGAIANLTIEQFPQSESGTVTIRRADTSGTGKGITGTYTGTRKGSMIEGTLSWTWPGHPDDHADWRAVILTDPVHMVPAAAHPFSTIPSSLSVCEDGHGCSMWTFNGKTGAIPGLANLSVERFDDSVIAIRRQEVAGALKGIEILYVGLRSGNKVDGVATWKWSGQPPVGILGWHTTLSSPAAPSQVASTQPAPAASSELPPGLPIEKLVDVVKPVAVLKDQPPPPARWQAKKSVAAFDLNGIWEAQGLSTRQSERIAVFQLRDHLVATTIKSTVRGRELFLPGTLMFRATVTSPNSASGQFEDEDMSVYTIIDAFDTVITSTGADDFQTSQSLMGNHVNDFHYHRISANRVEDLPCEISNPHHIFRDEALQRGDIYLLENDPVTANCWFYSAAVEGNSDARAEYGRSLHDGRGLPANLPLGIRWIQQAAMDGSVRASGYMSILFAGGGLPPSNQRHNYWLARHLGTDPMVIHDNHHNSKWTWMDDTVPPCSPSNPKHVNGEDALKMGRVAYEAHSFQIAHCWLRISAEQNDMTAWTYLGIMSAFGMGVEANEKNAFGYMYHVAREKKDVYAMVYLANFYRLGIGVDGSDANGQIIMNAATNRPGGEDAIMRVGGTFVSPSQALFAGMNLLEASAVSELQCPETPEHYLYSGQNRIKVPASKPAGCTSPESERILSRIKINGPNQFATPEELYPENPFHDF